MKRSGLISLLAVVSLSLAVGCGKKGEGEKAGKAAASEESPAPAKLAYKAVGGFGIEANVPADAEIEDNTKSAGFPMATIWATPTTFVTGQNEMFWPKDLEAAKQEATKSANTFKGFTKQEATADGFHLEYTLESMIDKTPLYGFRLRRTIGGKQFDCHTNSDSEQQKATALAICNSLRAVQ